MAAKSKLTDKALEQILALVRSGMYPERAFVAAGLGHSTFRWLRAQAREGKRKYEKIVEDIEEAVAMCEAADVLTTRRAATIEKTEVECEHCGERMQVDPMLLLTMASTLQNAHSIKNMAANAAFQRLMLRFPKRWSPRVTHTIEEEHEDFLKCAQDVLAPEVFESLLEAYLARREGAAEAPGGTGEPPTGSVH